MFTSEDVKKLREMTGVGMLDCRNALVETNGDVDKAVEILREKGIAKAAKKASRIAAEGAVGAFVDGKIGVLVEINCESDFVSKGDKFQEIVNNIAKVIANNKPSSVEELNSCKFGEGTVADYMTERTMVIGEKLSIRRFEIFETTGKIETYIHMGGKVGVMVEACPFNGGEQILHDVALQIAAIKPIYLNRDEVPAEVLEKEKEILLSQMQNDEKNANKPKEILEKIVLGKIGKYYTENCLLDQLFVKDDSKTIKEIVANNFTLKRFVRFEMGEGLEKKNENFAEEVAKMGHKD